MNPSSWGRAGCAGLIYFLGASAGPHAGSAAAKPDIAPLAAQTIAAIRRDCSLAPDPAGGQPLPLAASWSDGTVVTGFGPGYQVDQIQHGQYLLPWFTLSVPPEQAGSPSASSSGGSYATPAEALYYEPAIQFLAQHRLPLSFETTQWETVMPRVSTEYAQTDAQGHIRSLSPFGSIQPWYAAGLTWARHPTLRRLQKLYPDPPLVLFISNNEYGKESPEDLHATYRPDDAESTARRRSVSDAWIARYQMLLRGFRDGLESPDWRAHAVFVGYDALVTPALGRWAGWMAYSWYVPGRAEPWPYAWDGASPSYYVHDWAPDSDYTVWGPEIEAMNYLPVLQQVRRVKPNFWFEISTWDGQLPGAPTDKRRFYREHRQELTAARYGGMVQFGLWLLRPRVARDFRNPEDDRIRFGSYFDTILEAVARVHNDPTLNGFWRFGRLVENPEGGHPYQANLPPEMALWARWFLLDSSANPPRPWELMTPLRVFALALERGERGRREWLVYAFSPTDDELQAEVKIPGGNITRVRAARGGAFTLVAERDGSTHPVSYIQRAN